MTAIHRPSWRSVVAVLWHWRRRSRPSRSGHRRLVQPAARALAVLGHDAAAVFLPSGESRCVDRDRERRSRVVISICSAAGLCFVAVGAAFSARDFSTCWRWRQCLVSAPLVRSTGNPYASSARAMAGAMTVLAAFAPSGRWPLPALAVYAAAATARFRTGGRVSRARHSSSGAPFYARLHVRHAPTRSRIWTEPPCYFANVWSAFTPWCALPWTSSSP